MSQIQETFLFQPTSVPGCSMWYDGADPAGTGVLPANGASITTWVDKSRNSRNATGGSSPTYNLANRSVVFNGSNYLFPQNSSGLLANKYFTVFIVERLNVFSPTLGNGIFGDDVVGGLDRALHITYLGEPYYWFRFAFYENDLDVTGMTQTGVLRMWTCSFVSFRNRRTYLNGSTAATLGNNRFLQAFATPVIGRNFATNYYNGQLYELVTFVSDMADSQREQMEGYLAWKWGLQANLPANHPFRTYRPLANPPVPTIVPPMPLINANQTPFLPTQISGCQLWLDAADSNTTIGNPVSQWNDKSASGLIFTQASAAARPSISTSPFSRSLLFTTAQTMSSSNQATLGPQQSWFLVFNSGNGVFFVEQSANTNNSNGSFLSGANADLFFIKRTGGSNFIDDAAVPFGTSPFSSNISYIASFVNDNTSNGNIWRINGTSRAITFRFPFNTLTGNVTDNFYINSRVPANIYHAEIIIYNASLSLSQVQQIEGYLAWKWNLTANLPANHPYKNQPIVPFPFRTTPLVNSSSSWQPTRISNCAVWMDGADRSTIIASNGNVTRWNDKITNGTQYATQASWVSPTLSSQNGLNALRFVAASGTGLTLNISSTNPKTTGYSYFVAYFPNANTNARIIHNEARMLIVNNVIFFAPSVQTTPTLTASASTLNVISVIEDTNTGVVNLNGSGNAVTTSLSSATFTYFTLGIGFTGLDRYDGVICEYVFYNRALNMRERQQVEGYLAWKWGGVGNLPSNHPFKLWPPSP